jgi:hypothetical protein
MGGTAAEQKTASAEQRIQPRGLRLGQLLAAARQEDQSANREPIGDAPRAKGSTLTARVFRLRNYHKEDIDARKYSLRGQKHHNAATMMH